MRKQQIPDHRKRRCSQCGAVLAVDGEAGTEVRRGDVDLVTDGRTSIVCYRCRRLNVFVHAGTRTANPTA